MVKLQFPQQFSYETISIKCHLSNFIFTFQISLPHTACTNVYTVYVNIHLAAQHKSNTSDSSVSPIQCSTATVEQGPGRAQGPKRELTAGIRRPRHCHLLRLHLHPS